MHEHRDVETAPSPLDATTSASQTDEASVDDLIEDVSIDGMCGVY